MSGGLGNQLFNYAAARTLADRHGVDLIIDASSYSDQWNPGAQRPFLISEFPIRATIRHMGPNLDVVPLRNRICRRIKEDLFADVLGHTARGSSGRAWWQYHPDYEKLSRRVIMKGHFINLKFFEKNTQSIREDLTLNYEKMFLENRINSQICEAIRKSSTSVSIHVRRGDLLSSQFKQYNLNNIEEYYYNSINYFLEKYNDVDFWVFSDDMKWCHKVFSKFGCNVHFVDRKLPLVSNVLEDFILMSTCDHQIIANSTFSWWAAWLNPSINKKVLAPRRWDNNAVIPMDEIIPADWLMIPW